MREHKADRVLIARVERHERDEVLLVDLRASASSKHRAHQLNDGRIERVEAWIRRRVDLVDQQHRVKVEEAGTSAWLEAPTHRSSSFFRLAVGRPGLTRSIFDMRLRCGSSRLTMQLIALRTPLKYLARSSMNCDSSR